MLSNLEYNVLSMSSSIRISEETKQKLEAIKRPEETFDELLARLAVDRTEDDIEQLAGFGDDGIEAHMQERRSERNESLDGREQDLHEQLDQS